MFVHFKWLRIEIKSVGVCKLQYERSTDHFHFFHMFVSQITFCAVIYRPTASVVGSAIKDRREGRANPIMGQN